MKDVVMDELKNNFRPEFINRIDEIIVFHPLTQAEITQIVDVMLAEVRKRLVEQEYELELTEEVHALLAKEGYNPSYGARPLRRAIQRLIEDPLAEEILAGVLKKGTILARKDGEKVVFGMKGEESGESKQEAKAGV
jgi:ATP-dependent Clp protease ATP-binding subunit ClpC